MEIMPNFKIDTIKKEVTHLSLHEQAELARWLILNLDDAQIENENEIDAAWRKEIRSRVNEIKENKIAMIPSEKMWKDLLENYVKRS